jgi:transcriptional regulator with XRE-family HTH domain
VSAFKGLPDALRLLCEREGRELKDIAAEAGVSASMLSGYLSARRTPSLATLEKLLEAMGVGLDGLAQALRVVEKGGQSLPAKGEPLVFGFIPQSEWDAVFDAGLDAHLKRRGLTARRAATAREKS